MKYRVITVVYTKRRLSALEIAEQKKYCFICDNDVKIGDMVDSPTYMNPCQIIDVSWSDHIPIINGKYAKNLIVDKINGKSVKPDYDESINSNKMQKNPNSMFSGIMSKYTGQFIPVKEDKVRMSLSGLLCVPQDGEYIGVNGDNLVSFPVEMTLPIPVYSIMKANSAIVPGDIIKNGNSYSKVINVNPDGSLKILSFTGYTHNKKPVTDFIMGAATTRVLINMFNFDEKTGFNPIFFAMANGDTLDVNSLMMLSMTPQGKNLFSNAGGSFNPMMLWMLDKNRQESGQGVDMMTMMMMSSAMGGQNPFVNMFGQSVMQETKPNVDEALNTILSNPDALAKLKDALKTE